jgi:alcohol sulfotransferase
MSLSWIDRLRLPRSERKRLAAFDKAQVIFLSPGKSGRTWIRAMLSHAFHKHFGTPADMLIAGDNLKRLDRRIPSMLFIHGYEQPPVVQRQLTAEGLRSKTVIALVRDPRDVLVSHYHHFHNRSASYARRHGDAARPEPKPIGRYVVGGKRVQKLVERIDELRTLARAVPNGHLFQYEAFRHDPVHELDRLARAIGCELPPADIEAAVEFARFENLKKREAENFFRDDALRSADPAQPNAFKVRRGKIGGFADELAPAEIAELDRQIDALLAPGLGYRSDERSEPRNVAAV